MRGCKRLRITKTGRQAAKRPPRQVVEECNLVVPCMEQCCGIEALPFIVKSLCWWPTKKTWGLKCPWLQSIVAYEHVVSATLGLVEEAFVYKLLVCQGVYDRQGGSTAAVGQAALKVVSELCAREFQPCPARRHHPFFTGTCSLR